MANAAAHDFAHADRHTCVPTVLFRAEVLEFGLAKLPIVIGHYGPVQPSLQGVPARPAILVFALAAGALLSYQATRLWLAYHRIHSTRLEIIERGVALEPGNADAWDLLGRYRQLDFANADPQQELADYQRAVQEDPLNASFWMNLAGAYEENGDLSAAQNAFERARSVYPLSAEVAWNYGNFLLRQGKEEQGYAEIHHAVQSDPRMLTLAISRVWRSSRDVNVLLDQVLPADVDAYIQAVDFFASIRQSDPALAVWRRVISLGQVVALPRTFPFLDELILDDRAADARQVWIEALTAAGLPHNASTNRSLVWNGDFSRDFDNGGLGWRWQPYLGGAIDFDSPPPSYGVRSVRLQFNGGTNLTLAQPGQYVPVEPSVTYDFHAYMRTEGITTESGIRFSITDPNHDGAVDQRTENMTGSHGWTSVNLVVTSAPSTHFLVIRVVRDRSRLFENRLSGLAWIADVSLIPEETKVDGMR
jgi:tetratricopeptide (TPR) repeat protein